MKVFFALSAILCTTTFVHGISRDAETQTLSIASPVKSQISNSTINEFSNLYNSINENIGYFSIGFLSQINSSVVNATQTIFGDGPQFNGTTTQTKKYLVDALLFFNTIVNSVDKLIDTINETIAQQEPKMKYLEKNLVVQMSTNLSASCKPVAVRGIGDIRIAALQNTFSCVYDEVDNYREIIRNATALITDINTSLDTEHVDLELMSNISSTFDIVMNEFAVTQVRFQDCKENAMIAITALAIVVSTKIAACQIFGIIF